MKMRTTVPLTLKPNSQPYLTSKSDLEIKPLVSSERIDEFNLIDEVSLSEYDEEIVSRFNDLFNVIHLDDSKLEKDNHDNDIGIMQSSEGDEITHGENGISETSHDKIIKTFETGSFVINLNIVIGEYYVNEMLFILIINLYVPFGIPFDPKRYYKDGSHTKVVEAKELDMAPLLAADQRHPWLRYQIEEYTEGIRHSYEQRLETIWSRSVNRVHILDFEGLTPRDEAGSGSEVEDGIFWRGAAGIRKMSDTEMGLDVANTQCFQLGGVRRRMAWRQFILTLGLHMEQEMAEAGFGAYWLAVID
ncbi:hypothetical protein Tco_0216571 [Tanacetum coccineum]